MFSLIKVTMVMVTFHSNRNPKTDIYKHIFRSRHRSVVLGIRLTALCMRDKYSTREACPYSFP